MLFEVRLPDGVVKACASWKVFIMSGFLVSRPEQPVILAYPFIVFQTEMRKVGGIHVMEVLRRQGRVTGKNVVDVILVLIAAAYIACRPCMGIYIRTHLYDMLHEQQAFLQVFLGGYLLVRMGIVIAATQVDATDTEVVLFQCQHIGHHAGLFGISPFLRLRRLKELFRAEFRAAYACNQFGVPFPVRLDNESHVVEKGHVRL